MDNNLCLIWCKLNATCQHNFDYECIQASKHLEDWTLEEVFQEMSDKVFTPEKVAEMRKTHTRRIVEGK